MLSKFNDTIRKVNRILFLIEEYKNVLDVVKTIFAMTTFKWKSFS